MARTMTIADRERQTLNIAKAIAILSVMAAHVVPLVEFDTLTSITSSVWSLFGEVGVIIFFLVGGFLYSRKDGDDRTFWKKKTFHLLLPWFFCSLLTYLLQAVLSRSISITAYLKWIFGSGTWYYYATIYTLFLFAFKWLYKNDIILGVLIGTQTVALILRTIGISTTIPLEFFTDYLNPLHWVGYFSAGIMLKRHWPNVVLRPGNVIPLVSAIILLISGFMLHKWRIYTYFSIFSSVFCVSFAFFVLFVSYKLSKFHSLNYIGKIGEYTLCIYLLHMQIAQGAISRIPDGAVKIILSPFIGLFLMLLLIEAGLWVCQKISFGDKIKLLVGL